MKFLLCICGSISVDIYCSTSHTPIVFQLLNRETAGLQVVGTDEIQALEWSVPERAVPEWC